MIFAYKIHTDFIAFKLLNFIILSNSCVIYFFGNPLFVGATWLMNCRIALLPFSYLLHVLI